MKSRPLLFPLTLLALANFASADTFILKDGTELQAKIVKENADSYDLDVLVTKSIRDERTVLKSDVKEIVKEKLDETAFAKLKDLVPVPDLQTTEEYEKRIRSATVFLREFPKSPKAAEVTKMLETLKSESAAIGAGGIKLGGSILAASDYKMNAYEIDAKILDSRIREAVARGETVSALRGIARMDKDFRWTKINRELAPLNKQLLNAYRAYILNELKGVDARTAEQAAGLAKMAGDARANTERALAEEQAVIDRQFKAEVAAGQVWTTTHPNHRASLEAAENAISNAISAASQELEKRGDSAKYYRAVYELARTSDDLEAIRESILKLEEFEVPLKYMTPVKEAAAAKGVTF